MYSFLLVVGGEFETGRRMRRRSLETARRLMPALGQALEAEVGELEGLGGYWLLRPAGSGSAALVSARREGDRVAVCFGVVYGLAASAAAAQILAAWREGGVEAARGLDGCYGAVVADERAGQVELVSDPIGRRSLRYALVDGGLLVSPHDLPLVATGAVKLELDPTSIASALACDWSLGGRPLTRTISVHDPNETALWRQRQLTVARAPRLLSRDRLDPRDRRGLDGLVDEGLETMRLNSRRFIGDATELECDLTAGFDSRAVFALARAEKGPARLTALTGGAEQSLEVRTAAAIARRHGVAHRTLQPEPPDPDDFFRHLRLRAFAMNGDTGGQRALEKPPTLKTTAVPHFFGGGAETYRCFYYPQPAPFETLAAWRLDRAHQILAERFSRRIAVLPWAAAEPAEGVLGRLREVIDRYGEATSSGADALDLFYLFERYGRWGAMAARFNWLEPIFSPFDSPRLAQLMFRLPAPISRGSRLHRRIIKTLLPRAYWVPVNRKALAPLAGATGPATAVAKAASYVLRGHDRLLAGLSPSERTASYEDMRRTIMADLLRKGLGDRILHPQSASRLVLDPRRLAGLIDEHAAGTADHLVTLGILATIEEWLLLMRQATLSN